MQKILSFFCTLSMAALKVRRHRSKASVDGFFSGRLNGLRNGHHRCTSADRCDLRTRHPFRQAGPILSDPHHSAKRLFPGMNLKYFQADPFHRGWEIGGYNQAARHASEWDRANPPGSSPQERSPGRDRSNCPTR